MPDFVVDTMFMGYDIPESFINYSGERTDKCVISGKDPATLSEKIETAIQKIQRKLMAQNEREVASSVLGEWVMEELRALDEVAYIRFASVYRQFQDIEAFKREIDKLMKK